MVTATATAPAPVRSRPETPRIPSRWMDFLAVAVFVLLGLVVAGHYLPDPNGRISALLPDDNTWFEWLLAHGAYSLRHFQNPLFSVRQNAPDGVNMMANTSVLGVTLPLAPLTLLVGAKVTYVIWLVLAPAATAATTYWVLSRHLVSSRGAALAAGALAGFAPGVVHHANGQPNFLSNFLLPLIALRVLRLGIGERPVRDGVILGLLVTWQVFINEELLVIAAVAVAMAVVAYSVLRWDDARVRLRAFAVSLAVAVGTVLVLCAYPLWMQFAGPQHYQGIPEYNAWGEDPVAYVTMPRNSLGGSAISDTTIGRSEQNTWFGWPLTGVTVVLAVLLRKRLAARIAIVSGLICAICSLGPRLRFDGHRTSIPGLWALVPARTPLLGMMMPSRFSFGVIAAFVVLVALGWDTYRRDKAVPAMIAAALIPLFPTPVAAIGDAPVPHFITSGDWRPYVTNGGTLVPVPLPDHAVGRPTLGWSARQDLGFPVPRGYFLGPDANGDAYAGAADPSILVDLTSWVIQTGQVPPIGASDRNDILAELHHWHASVVVLGKQRDEAQLQTLLTQLFGPGRKVDDVWIWQPLKS